ncbi:unknown protein [Seminavis robusta]|uniref:Uncharacterized protein n=1 Tax=Seminavis robusta TaxID=568900 RepID=A0A9N8DT54_9STRA|nr:unknown protein [Seminavis robusta]|eukprot:Sro259_g101410.1 n/a (158) ;mRNA; f:55783-56350
MTTSSKDLASEFNNVAGTISEIRDDYRLPSPNGYVCETGLKQTNCDEMRRLFNDTARLGFGDIMAGVWCPRENNTLRNCPVGSYCPNSKTRLTCPKGFFCPHKTAVPEISCPACDEGAESLARNKTLNVVLPILYTSMLLWCLGVLVKRRRALKEET